MNTHAPEGTTFPPGTIVMQYVDDSTRYVGVVVGDEHAHRLSSPRDVEYFNLPHLHGQYHICLVLGWFTDYGPSNSQFAEYGVRAVKFPHFAIGKMNCATPHAFEEEITLLKSQRAMGTSRGLNGSNLRETMFSFSKRQRETLCMVEVVAAHLAGAALPPGSFLNGELYVPHATMLLDELKILLPRE